MENCFIVSHPDSKHCVIIDPGDQPEAILGEVERSGRRPQAILITHGHLDHIGAAGRLKDQLGIPVYLKREDLVLYSSAPEHALRYGIQMDSPPEPDAWMEDHQNLCFEGFAFQVLHTPGHTPGHVTLLCGPHAFVGDCLFAGSIGRTDLPGGSFEILMQSLREVILALPGATIVHPGHGPDTTISRELATNPFLR